MKADPYRPTTWVEYKKGMCEGCWGGCCTLPVEATVSDFVRMEILTQEESEMLSLKEISKKLEKLRLIQAFQPKQENFILTQRGGRDCMYLHEKTRLCTIYEKRPETCRNFPKIGPRPGFCPQSKG